MQTIDEVLTIFGKLKSNPYPGRSKRQQLLSSPGGSTEVSCRNLMLCLVLVSAVVLLVYSNLIGVLWQKLCKEKSIRVLTSSPEQVSTTISRATETDGPRRRRKVNPHNYELLLSPKALCRADDPPFLLILVPSIPEHMDVRNAIRTTWGGVSKTNFWPHRHIDSHVALAFLLGARRFRARQQIIEAENRKYGDIIQEDFLDSYGNLSIKIVMGLKWTWLNCAKACYILKADQDTFVNIPKLISILRQQNSSTEILGSINTDAKVFRVGKWKVEKFAFFESLYPPYASGNSYVIPGKLAKSLYRTSEYIPVIPVEDAYITGILAKAVGARHKNVAGFTFWLDKPPVSCDFILDRKISGTKVSMGLMKQIWADLTRHIDCDRGGT